MVTLRILFTAKQKDELWQRWKNGQNVLAISRALERRNKTGVQRIVALNGGIAPAPRLPRVPRHYSRASSRLHSGTLARLGPVRVMSVISSAKSA